MINVRYRKALKAKYAFREAYEHFIFFPTDKRFSLSTAGLQGILLVLVDRKEIRSSSLAEMTMFMQLFTPIFVTKLPDTVVKTLCRYFLDTSKYKPLLPLAT